PRVRYAIACAALALMVAAPLATARVLWRTQENLTTALTPLVAPVAPEANGRPAESMAAHRSSVRPAEGRFQVTRARLDQVMPIVVGLWFAGFALCLARALGGWWQVRRMYFNAMASSASRWQSACRRLAYRMGLHAAAHV